MRQSSAERARPQIISFLDNLTQSAFTFSHITNILEENRTLWHLAQTMTTPKFIQFLTDRGKLTTHRFNFSSQPTMLFYWEDPTVYEVAMLLRPNGYLSHRTAMQYHQLIDEDGENAIYLNVEQTPKPRPHGNLEQFRIDAAFKRPSRTTQNQAQDRNYTFYLLSGKHTNMLGVEHNLVSNVVSPIRVSNIERTLIDIVVRPAYSGGVMAIVEAYKRAANKVSVERMVEVLAQLQYVYPYHQAIGFFMEHSQSYSREQIELLNQHPKKFDFYADYEITEPRYSPEWRLYYPSCLDEL